MPIGPRHGPRGDEAADDQDASHWRATSLLPQQPVYRFQPGRRRGRA